MGCEGFFDFYDAFGFALVEEVAAVHAAGGTEVNEPVCGFDDFEVVFYDEDGVAVFYEGIEGVKEFEDVVKMEAGGGFIKYEEDVFAGEVFG